MKFDIKLWLLDQQVKKFEFVTNSGNGKHVPCYELKNGELVLLKNKKTGEVCTHNLYNDIQSFAHVNDYLKILKDNPNALDQVSMSINNGKIPVVRGFDYSELGSFDDLVQASQKFKDAGFNSFDDVLRAKVAHEKKLKEQKQKKDGDVVKSEDKK